MVARSVSGGGSTKRCKSSRVAFATLRNERRDARVVTPHEIGFTIVAGVGQQLSSASDSRIQMRQRANPKLPAPLSKESLFDGLFGGLLRCRSSLRGERYLRHEVQGSFLERCGFGQLNEGRLGLGNAGRVASA